MAKISYIELWTNAEKVFANEVEPVLDSLERYITDKSKKIDKSHQVNKVFKREINNNESYQVNRILKYYAFHCKKEKINEKIEKKLIHLFGELAIGFNLSDNEKKMILNAWKNFINNIDPILKIQIQFVHNTVWKKFPHSLKGEIISSGVWGVIKAIPGYDYKRKAAFSTYARKWIYGEIRKTLNEKYNAKIEEDIPDHSLGSEKMLVIKNAIENLLPDERIVLLKLFFKEKTGRETAAQMNLTEGRITQLKQSALQKLKELINIF